jgi:DNA-directed RNA polymerase specialized sigma24 family protein
MATSSRNRNVFVEKCYLGNDSDINVAEDDYHDAIVRIIRNKKGYDNIVKHPHIINSVAKNVRYERINAVKSELKHLKQLYEQNKSSSGCKGLDNSVEYGKPIQDIITAISGLPTKSRQAIILVDILVLKPKEAAELIDCDFKVFRNRLSYARKIMRERMKKTFLL